MSLQYNTGAGGDGYEGNATTAFSANTGLVYNTTYNFAPPRTFGVELRYKFF